MAQILGVQVNSGVSKKSNKPYAIINVAYKEAIPESVESDSFNSCVYGMNIVIRQLQIDISNPGNLPVFEQTLQQQKFPCEAELVIEERFTFGEFKSQLVGLNFKPSPQSVPAPASKTA